jgi:dienelactone hydrolase
MRCLHRVLVALLAVTLFATISAHADTGPPAAPARGALVQNVPTRVLSISPSDFVAILQASGQGAQLLQLAGTPKCGIDIYKLQYFTVGGAGESTTASAALMVPTGNDADCRGTRPVVIYAHGTMLDRNYDIANISASDNNEGLWAAAVFAAQGYVLVAPNYAGYDTSSLTYHPYVNADQQSKDTIDALTAARRALPKAFAADMRDRGELFITGFSQGGHVAMATHRALQALGMPVTASAPISGPYALAAYADELFAGRVDIYTPIYMTLVVNSYQHSYGNIYASATDIVQARYANSLDLLPATNSDVFSRGALPTLQVFAREPPAPQFASMTPATTPANIAPLFPYGFGPNHLITNDYRLQYLLDALENPDGGWPTLTTGVPAANPGSTLRQALKANDLRDWSPVAPVMLCGGSGDLNFMNALLMQQYWAAARAPTRISLLNIDSPPLPKADPYASLKAGFAAAKAAIAAGAVAQGATDGGALAVLASYHLVLEEPYCLPAARVFFEHQRHLKGRIP